MMRNSTIYPILLATAFALAGCGGGGSEFVNSTPPPPITPTPGPTPTPTSTNAIIPLATASQQFAVMGSSNLGFAASDQLQVRYVASSNSYEVQVPNSQDWVAVSYSTRPVPTLIDYTGGAALWLRDQGYRYSRLMEWAGGIGSGHEAVGMATPATGVPVTGSAGYHGDILGYTSEVHPNDDMSILGSIGLIFNFGAGTLSGSIDPILQQEFAQFPLDTTNFKDTVYSTGSTSFSGKFDTNLAGTNSFAGQFTGPAAEELIGNFAFPYQSPIDGQTYQTDGAFVGAR